MRRRAVGPTAKIYAWLEAHPDGARWDGLLAWIQAVAIDHEMCTSSEWVKPGTNRRFCVSHLPTARTSVVFAVVDQPVFAVHILRIDDDLFDAAS